MWSKRLSKILVGSQVIKESHGAYEKSFLSWLKRWIRWIVSMSMRFICGTQTSKSSLCRKKAWSLHRQSNKRRKKMRVVLTLLHINVLCSFNGRWTWLKHWTASIISLSDINGSRKNYRKEVNCPWKFCSTKHSLARRSNSWS